MSPRLRPHLHALTAGIALLLAADSGRAYLSFSTEQLVASGGTDIAVPGYSVPSLCDWNSDGLPDIVVGEGTTTGRVRVYLNDGKTAAPHFSGYFYAQSLGADLTVPGGG